MDTLNKFHTITTLLLLVLNLLVRVGLPVLSIPELLHVSTPRHALAAHIGLGRLETLRAVIESIKSGSRENTYKAKPITHRLADSSSKQRRTDKMMPPQLACLADNLSFELIPAHVIAGPSYAALVDTRGRTPLHLLYNSSSTRPYIRRGRVCSVSASYAHRRQQHWQTSMTSLSWNAL